MITYCVPGSVLGPGDRVVNERNKTRAHPHGFTFRMCVCVCVRVRAHMLSQVQLFATPWTVTCQAPLSMEFSRQEYWSGLPFPTPRGLPNLGIESASPTLAGGFFFNHCATWEAQRYKTNDKEDR